MVSEQYRHFFYADRADALTLGIEGAGPEATAARFELASKLYAEQVARHEAIYARAQGTVDPDPRGIFVLDLLVKHQGDVGAVVTDRAFEFELRCETRAFGEERVIRDGEGGDWVEWLEPTVEEVALYERELAALRSLPAAGGGHDVSQSHAAPGLPGAVAPPAPPLEQNIPAVDLF